MAIYFPCRPEEAAMFAAKACQTIRKLVLLLENPFMSFIQQNERIS